MESLQTILTKYDAIVFFDTETTGLDANKHQIIELAAARVESWHNGTPFVTDQMDLFIKLPDGQTLPEEIVNLTGITDAMLAENGVSADEAAAQIANMMRGSVLMCAHNAQFDAGFLRNLMKGRTVNVVHWLDTLTVFKDRRAYPHKLANAISAYGLEDRVQNSHRAIDDVLALMEVTAAMAEERNDLDKYVNLFGYNPKYGVSGLKIKGVRYLPQRFWDFMTTVGTALYSY